MKGSTAIGLTAVVTAGAVGAAYFLTRSPPSSSCVGQPCSPACPNGTCPSGETCVNGTCTPSSCAGQPCSPTCPNGSCNGIQTCVHGTCTCPTGECGVGCPCPSGFVCVGGRCREVCPGAPGCGANVPCPAGCDCVTVNAKLHEFACVVSGSAGSASGSTGWPWLDMAASPLQSLASSGSGSHLIWGGAAGGG